MRRPAEGPSRFLFAKSSDVFRTPIDRLLGCEWKTKSERSCMARNGMRRANLKHIIISRCHCRSFASSWGSSLKNTIPRSKVRRNRESSSLTTSSGVVPCQTRTESKSTSTASRLSSIFSTQVRAVRAACFITSFIPFPHRARRLSSMAELRRMRQNKRSRCHGPLSMCRLLSTFLFVQRLLLVRVKLFLARAHQFPRAREKPHAEKSRRREIECNA